MNRLYIFLLLFVFLPSFSHAFESCRKGTTNTGYQQSPTSCGSTTPCYTNYDTTTCEELTNESGSCTTKTGIYVYGGYQGVSPYYALWYSLKYPCVEPPPPSCPELYEWKVNSQNTEYECHNVTGSLPDCVPDPIGSPVADSNCQGEGPKPPSSCLDGITSGAETSLDCGDPACPDQIGPCAPPPGTCGDGRANGNEISLDCGDPACPGQIGPCPEPPPTCSDGLFNGNETNKDCGDPYCSGQSSACPPVAAHCGDGVRNTDELSLDCGGADCRECTAQPITCTDGVIGQDEGGVDCGGSCYENEPCDSDPTNGIMDGAEKGIDCGSAASGNAMCASDATNGVQDGDETGIDCGGATSPACIEGDPAIRTQWVNRFSEFIATMQAAPIFAPLFSLFDFDAPVGSSSIFNLDCGSYGVIPIDLSGFGLNLLGNAVVFAALFYAVRLVLINRG